MEQCDKCGAVMTMPHVKGGPAINNLQYTWDGQSKWVHTRFGLQCNVDTAVREVVDKGYVEFLAYNSVLWQRVFSLVTTQIEVMAPVYIARMGRRQENEELHRCFVAQPIMAAIMELPPMPNDLRDPPVLDQKRYSDADREGAAKIFYKAQEACVETYAGQIVCHVLGKPLSEFDPASFREALDATLVASVLKSW